MRQKMFLAPFPDTKSFQLGSLHGTLLKHLLPYCAIANCLQLKFYPDCEFEGKNNFIHCYNLSVQHTVELKKKHNC